MKKYTIKKNSLTKTNPFLKNANNLELYIAEGTSTSCAIEGVHISPQKLVKLIHNRSFISFVRPEESH